MAFKEIRIEKAENFNPFSRIGKDWMLISAGTKEKFNTMTASWGGAGVLWNKNVAFAFVRPQRYTFEFLEKSDYFSLCFFPSEPQYRRILSFCGKQSGRNTDKIAETGLTPVQTAFAPYYAEANLVLICKKIYGQFLKPSSFIDESLESNYELKDYHKMFIGEITECLVKE